MSVLNPGAALRKTLYGERVTSAVTAITGASDKALFTITGGRVIITSLVGEVTTVVQTQANNAKVKFNPTATGADTDLTAAADITGLAVGVLVGVSGLYTDTLLTNDGVLQVPAAGFGGPFMLSEGDIELETSASSTGAIQWTLTYVPYDDGAAVASA